MTILEQVQSQAAALVLESARQYGVEAAAAQMARCVIEAMSDKTGMPARDIDQAIAREPTGPVAETFFAIAAGIIGALK